LETRFSAEQRTGERDETGFGSVARNVFRFLHGQRREETLHPIPRGQATFGKKGPIEKGRIRERPFHKAEGRQASQTRATLISPADSVSPENTL